MRKAAFQSLGAFISTFYVPGTPPSLDDSLPPLSDSFLDSGQLTSTGESTSDSSIENRHSESSKSSTPPLVGTNLESDELTEVDFVPSEIARTSSQESLEKSLQDMSVEDLETLPLDESHNLCENASLDKGHDLCVDESEENDILDSAIKKIESLDEGLVIHPPPIKSVKLDREPEAAKNKNENKPLNENSQSLFDNNHNVTEVRDTPPSEATPTKHSRLTELLQDDNARIRCSSEGSSFKSYFDPVVRAEVGNKKRRWSLDKNNTTSQVSHTPLPHALIFISSHIFEQMFYFKTFLCV